MSYGDVMNMPVKAFWALSNAVVRVMAEQDMRALSVAVHATSGEGAEKFRDHLQQQMGAVTIQETEFDQSGYNDLKRMAAM